ncbi:site-specific integrase [Rhodanobacter sp. OK091]|uniref:tyrosine-type recombinase/integrase n=1 Tax=Rhodanobacter sp. OK091 TaxID=1881037 RepID=UPI000921BB53|nr:site-specific integrase [Rhodanobacter sp. OK091]SHL89518.1 Site-specific recombinase XerC [Rhodanobacter sp. OK091]
MASKNIFREEKDRDDENAEGQEKSKRLNVASLRNAYGKKRDKREILWGTDGLYAEVLTSGRITFRYRYRLPGTGKRDKITLGSYPALPLKEAYRLHAEKRSEVALGKSPAEVKRGVRLGSARTFSDLAADWVENDLKPANKNSLQDETYLRRDILPVIGSMELTAIDKASLWRCIDPVRSRGHGQAARRVQSVLKRVFDYCVRRGNVSKNPVTGIDPRHVAPAQTRDRVLSREEIPVWLQAVETSSLPRPMKLALRLLLLIPVRKGELLAARWTDISNGVWDIPKDNSKNGAPIRHKLSAQAVGIFNELHELAAGSCWVLPSSRGYGKIPLSKSGINTALRNITGLPSGVVIHDLRRTVRTHLSDLGVATNVAELCLNHRPTGIKKVYDRSELLDQRFAALLKWESYLQSLSTKPASPDNARVVRELDTLLERIRDDESLRAYVIKRLMATP